jgi:hypothetical protein
MAAVTEEVFVFRMVRIPIAMWQNIKADEYLQLCAHGKYATVSQLEAILRHMRVHGAEIKHNDDVTLLKLEDMRHWHIIVTASYLDAFLAAIRTTPSSHRASIRDSGSFKIKQVEPGLWKSVWPDM